MITINTNNALQPLPDEILVTEPDYITLVNYLLYCKSMPLVSVDIETIRPKAKSEFHALGHPGYPYTIALAPSAKEAISFSFWEYDPTQIVRIWRLLDEILYTIPNIGQNYYSFDSHYLERMGYRSNIKHNIMTQCYDITSYGLDFHISYNSLPNNTLENPITKMRLSFGPRSIKNN